MKILCNGCSYTATTKETLSKVERHTWPVFIQKELPDSEIINFGTMAAGNRYIKETTIEYLESNQVDAVVVMWSGLGRIDVNITDEEYELCCKQNNPKTRYVGFKEQNYRNWFFTGGVWCRQDISLSELFPNNKIIVDLFLKYLPGYRIHEAPLERILSSINNMIDLQQYLTERNIPFVFTSYQNYWNKQSAEMLKNKLNVDIKDKFSYNSGGSPYVCDFEKLEQYAKKYLDFSKWCWAGAEGRTVFEIAMEDFKGKSGSYDDGDHPNAKAQEVFVKQFLLPKLLKATQ